MNNNEAKKTILEAESCFCKHGAYKDCHSGCKYCEALDAAVKALEQEPTTKNELVVDCIDRNSIKYYPGTGGYMYASKGEIDKLPSVTPQEPILDKIFCITHPLSIMSTPELEHKAIMQIAEMLEPLCLLESEDK